MIESTTPQALTQWVARVRPRATPGLSSTVLDILRLIDRRDSGAGDLAYVILRDPSLTARLLRAANAFVANPTGHEITTVSRAIVLLGFNAVRRIAVSLSLIDDCLRGPMREHVARELALCVHAATQARSLAKFAHDPQPEEIYIAALLFSLGSIVFWSSGDGATVELHRALGNRQSMSGSEVERAVLGFDLGQLTRNLNQEWHVSRVLDDVLSGRTANDVRGWCVHAGHDLAGAAENGWDSAIIENLLGRLASELGIETRILRTQVYANAGEARRTAELYNAAHVGRLIPQPR